MKIRILFVFAILLLTTASFAQNKRNVFYFSTSGSFSPGILGSLSYGKIRVNKGKSTNFDDRDAQYNGRLNFGYTFLTSKRFGLGLKFSYQRLRIPVAEQTYFGYDYQYFPSAANSSGVLEFESPAFNSYTAMFLLKFAPKMSMLPFGMEYSIGIGPRFFSMVNKPYYGIYTDTSGAKVKGDIPQINNKDLENQRYRGTELYYGMELNYSVGQNSFVFMGVDFSLTLVNVSSYKSIDETNYDHYSVEEKVEDVFYNKNYGRELRNRTIFSIASFQIGYKIVL